MDGNNGGDVTEGNFFISVLLDSFSLFLGPFHVSSSLSSSLSLEVLVNKAICVQTLLWYSPSLALSLYLFSPFSSLGK